MPTTYNGAVDADFIVGFSTESGGTGEATFALTFGPQTAGYNDAIVTEASTTRLTFHVESDGTSFSIRPIVPTSLTLSAASDETLTLTPA